MNLIKKLRVMLEPPSPVSNHKQQKSLRAFIGRFDDTQVIGDIGSGHNKYNKRKV